MRKQKSIRYYLAYGLTWLLAISFLNTVVDTPDLTFTGHTSYNEMESIVEWVTEDLLDIEDAFPEEEENDTEKKTQHFAYDWEHHSYNYLPLVINSSRLFVPRNNDDHSARAIAIITPPPDKV